MATKKKTTSSKKNMHDVLKKTFIDIPNEQKNAKRIDALVKENNKVVGYEIAGEFVSKAQAIQMASKGMIKGVGISKRGNTKYLKSLPDGSSKTNLSSLPSKTRRK